jgi:hypothetical protein
MRLQVTLARAQRFQDRKSAPPGAESRPIPIAYGPPRKIWTPDFTHRVAPAYIEAKWVGTTLHPRSGNPVLLLQTPGGEMRFHLSPSCGASIVEEGADFWLHRSLISSHSVSSAGIPHREGSHPDEGLRVYPKINFSTAVCGEEYEPSGVPSNIGRQRPRKPRISNIPHRLSNLQKTCMSWLRGLCEKLGILGRRASRVKSAAQQVPTGEGRRAVAADLCARISRDLGALRFLCDEAGLDAEEDFIAEAISEFEDLSARLAETAKWG